MLHQWSYMFNVHLASMVNEIWPAPQYVSDQSQSKNLYKGWYSGT